MNIFSDVGRSIRDIYKDRAREVSCVAPAPAPRDATRLPFAGVPARAARRAATALCRAYEALRSTLQLVRSSM